MTNKEIKIYFGFLPKNKSEYYTKYNIDSSLHILYDIGFENVLDFIENFCMENDRYVVYTGNPILINFLDDEYASDHVYWFDNDGNEHKFKDSPFLMNKLKCMGPGEVICDSFLFYNNNRY